MGKNKSDYESDKELRKSQVDLKTFDPVSNRNKIITKEVDIEKCNDFHDDFLKTIGCDK